MTSLPKRGKSWSELDGEMDAARKGDVDWRRGRVGVYIHYAGEEVLDIAKKAYLKFFSENGPRPPRRFRAWPGSKRRRGN